MATEKMELPQKKQIFATLRNDGVAKMDVERYVNWSKTPGPAPAPPSIPPGGVVKFNDLVSKGAVIYTGHNAENSPVSWVLAWEAPEARDAPEVIMPRARNKVYVICGSKSNIDRLTDDVIRAKLEFSSDKSMFADLISKTKVDAQMVDKISVPPGTAVALDANFGLLN